MVFWSTTIMLTGCSTSLGFSDDFRNLSSRDAADVAHTGLVCAQNYKKIACPAQLVAPFGHRMVMRLRRCSQNFVINFETYAFFTLKRQASTDDIL